MVKGIEHFPAHDVLQIPKIDYKTGLGIDRTLHSNFQSVVVTVTVRIIALAEDPLVLLWT
jgi:hypothetical protein